ncbi:MAG: hypothetical protein IKF24_01285, partial [Eubacterium sp.]|nr:hypothetical protein [Eubacterium sp.]
MKKLLAVLLIITLTFSFPLGFSLKTKGKIKSVEVNEKNFPDTNFRNSLKKQFTIKNGKLTEEIVSLDLTGVVNFKGLELLIDNCKVDD